LPNLKCEEGESRREGFVGVALPKEAVEKFIDGITIPEGRADRDPKRAEDLDDVLRQIVQGRRKPR
jgi:hypothetical protein